MKIALTESMNFSVQDSVFQPLICRSTGFIITYESYNSKILQWLYKSFLQTVKKKFVGTLQLQIYFKNLRQKSLTSGKSKSN